ncbi:7502_t:CDS:2, partial [Funneliformis geosporum]
MSGSKGKRTKKPLEKNILPQKKNKREVDVEEIELDLDSRDASTLFDELDEIPANGRDSESVSSRYVFLDPVTPDNLKKRNKRNSNLFIRYRKEMMKNKLTTVNHLEFNKIFANDLKSMPESEKDYLRREYHLKTQLSNAGQISESSGSKPSKAAVDLFNQYQTLPNAKNEEHN